jgi:cardiolipin synthase
MDGSLTLLSDPLSPDGADMTFKRVIQRIGEAGKTIEIYMFVWRNDAIGNEIGRAVLEAADRGVRIRIKKDRGAIMYERIEMNRKSFFHTELPPLTKAKFAVFQPTFPTTFVKDDFDRTVGNQVRDHENVTLDWVSHTHTKYYLFDEEVMITGSINIEDRHRMYHDYMVEITGPSLIRRFRQRDGEGISYDRERPIEFLLNHRNASPPKFEIKRQLMHSIAEAKETIYVEMAYIGDPEISAALIAAAGRGVKVTILFSRKANIGNDINYRSLHEICRNADVAVHLSDKMLHSKLMLFDGETVVLGSANISVFSMQKADELDILVHRSPDFLDAVKATINRRLGDGERFDFRKPLPRYNRVIASLQQLHQRLT